MTVKAKKSSKKKNQPGKPGPASGPAKTDQSSQKTKQAKKLPARKAGAGFWSLTNPRFVLLALVAISGLTFLVRCLHLIGTDHYFMISPDSHVFHWMAIQIMEGQPLPHIPTGLSYPLAYGAMAISWIFKVSNEQALTFLSKFVPPFLGVIAVLIAYVAVARMYDRRMGLAAAFAMALLPHAYFTQAAGYIDRDPLNVLLLMIGVFAFYFSRYWHVEVKGYNAAWVLGAVAVIAVEVLLYLQWSWMGPAMLLVVILAYSTVDLVIKFVQQPGRSDKDPYQPLSRQFFTRLKGAVVASRWQPVILILAANLIGGLAAAGVTGDTLRLIGQLLSPGGAEIAELAGFGRGDLLLFQFFLLLIPIGFILALMRRRDADVLFVSWFTSLLILSLFSRRVILLAIPAAAILGGMVIANLFDFRFARRNERRIQGIVAGMVVVVMLGLASFAHGLGNEQRVAANTDWQGAMTYLREETATDARVMTWWDYGYWILDMGQRRPIVDNGLYGHTRAQNRDIAMAYCHTDSSKAAEIMQKHRADYLIFSTVELEIWPVIASYSNPGKDPASVYQTSFYYKSLLGTYASEENLVRVYPDTDTGRSDLVIYRLAG